MIVQEEFNNDWVNIINNKYIYKIIERSSRYIDENTIKNIFLYLCENQNKVVKTPISTTTET